MQILSQQGTVIGTGNPGMQKMVAARPQVFVVAPESVEEFQIDALCLEAFKDPPRSTGEGKHKIKRITRNKKILKLLKAIREIEEEISGKIISVQGDRFQARPMSQDLSELARVSKYSRGRGGKFVVKLADTVIQCALWQITDKLDFDKFAKVVRADSAEARERLKEVAKYASIILRKAGLKPRIT